MSVLYTEVLGGTGHTFTVGAQTGAMEGVVVSPPFSNCVSAMLNTVTVLFFKLSFLMFFMAAHRF